LFVIEPYLPHTPQGSPAKVEEDEIVGKPAPDLVLPRLAQGTDSGKKTMSPVAGEPVRLSSFRGKKTVCIFLSSYT
jgi:hypothetical protein